MSDALARADDEDSKSGGRKEYGGKRQRLEGGDSSSSSLFRSSMLYDASDSATTSSSSSPPASSSTSSSSGPSVASIASFVESLQDDEPTIPDEVISSILRTTGCDVTDTRLLRLIALSAQRFLYQVAEDAQQISRMRRGQQSSGRADDGSSGKSSELCMEDLTVALSYAGIAVNKPPYYADHVDSSER